MLAEEITTGALSTPVREQKVEQGGMEGRIARYRAQRSKGHGKVHHPQLGRL